MIENEISLYLVYDSQTDEWWETPKGKKAWNAANHAKNAVNANPPEWMWGKDRFGRPSRYHGIKFSEQTRLVVHKATYTLANTTIC